MNKKNICIDSKVIIVLKIDPNLFGEICNIAPKQRFKYERCD